MAARPGRLILALSPAATVGVRSLAATVWVRSLAATVRLRSLALVGALSLAATVGGCGAEPTPPAGPAGVVHGTIVLTGGPSGASSAPGAGTVVVTRDGDEVTRQRVAERQEFSFALAPGRYRLTATGVDGACDTVGVTVAAGTDHAVSVTCHRT
jgi:hypothetical protein